MGVSVSFWLCAPDGPAEEVTPAVLARLLDSFYLHALDCYYGEAGDIDVQSVVEPARLSAEDRSWLEAQMGLDLVTPDMAALVRRAIDEGVDVLPPETAEQAAVVACLTV